MRISAEEAHCRLATWVGQKRQVRCIFTAPGISDTRSAFLWALNEELLTMRQVRGGPEGPLDVHVPLSDSDLEYFEPAEAPEELRPDRPLDWYDGVLWVRQPQLSETGASLELHWAIWIANASAWSEHV